MHLDVVLKATFKYLAREVLSLSVKIRFAVCFMVCVNFTGLINQGTLLADQMAIVL